jgi:ribose transport system substrate-binding protein
MSASAINLANLIAQGSGMKDLAEPEVPSKITVAPTTVTKDNVDQVMDLGY